MVLRSGNAITFIFSFYFEQELCNKGAVTLQIRSTQVEEAANELINMLMIEDEEEENDDDEDQEKDVAEESKDGV